MMADVLRRIKDSKCEAVEEFPLCQQPTDWLQPPTGHTSEIVADVVELGDRLCRKARDITFEVCHYLLALVAGILLS
jgi:hypothetical protein